MPFYRLLLTLAAPVLILVALWRGLRGRLSPGEVRERLGGGPGQRPSAATLWLHAASNGEAMSARPVIQALRARRPDLGIIVTTNTATGRSLVRGWGLKGVAATLAPLDFSWAVHRFIDRWSVAGLVIVENELWPNRLSILHRRGLPVIVIGARLSDRSFARWRRLPGLIGPLLDTLTLVSPQDRATEDRLRALGLPAHRIAPRAMLKAAVAPAPAPGSAPGRARTLLAASTHDGEDAPLLDAFLAARDRFDRLILAPRHPRRGAEIAALARARGLTPALRSDQRDMSTRTPLLIADSLGEMDRWYAQSGACFVGGSLVDRGGHTPFEPTAHGCAILHGPFVSNFAEAYDALDRAGAALPVTAETLASALQGLDPDRQAALAERARSALDGAAPIETIADLILAALDTGA